MFNIDMDSNINSNISRLSVSIMNNIQIASVDNLRTLIFVKGGNNLINGFTTNEINDLVNQLSVMYTVIKNNSFICLLNVCQYY